METTTATGKTGKAPAELSVGKMLAIVAAAMLVTMIATLWLIKLWLFPGPFSPVILTQAEARGLEAKLARLEAVENGAAKGNKGKSENDEIAAPTPYSEENASREIVFSEREVNALIGRNPDLAGKAAIDLADNLVSATILIPTNPDVPLIGGRGIRVKLGLTLASQDGRPVVALRGVSVMGVPMPNAWLGKLKNIDLIKRYGTDNGFWQFFAEGIDSVEIREGQAKIILKP